MKTASASAAMPDMVIAPPSINPVEGTESVTSESVKNEQTETVRNKNNKNNKSVESGKRRGRPATDRNLMMEEVITVLHDQNPNEVVFTRKQLNDLAFSGSVPISYILHFVEVCSTPIRGLYILPKQWRDRWPGYGSNLKSLFERLYNK
ncbi:MAG: hypothetical protein N3A54_01120 [Patescibacteria group bacterium]|nr:hypothetical protein [Patescibacteria group bacterium]